MPQVQVIEPVNAIFQYAPPKLRVCAYARVSSDSADQLNSFSVQMDHYQNLIAKNEEWELADVYADGYMPYGLTPNAHVQIFTAVLDISYWVMFLPRSTILGLQSVGKNLW